MRSGCAARRGLLPDPARGAGTMECPASPRTGRTGCEWFFVEDYIGCGCEQPPKVEGQVFMELFDRGACCTTGGLFDDEPQRLESPSYAVQVYGVELPYAMGSPSYRSRPSEISNGGGQLQRRHAELSACMGIFRTLLLRDFARK